MQNIKFNELIKQDSESLNKIIANYNDNNFNRVIVAIAELKSREYNINEYSIEKINEFIKENKFETFEEALTIFLKSNDKTNYNEFKKSNYDYKKYYEKEANYIITKPEFIISAGKSIKNAVLTSIALIACLIIGYFILKDYAKNDLEKIETIYKLMGFIIFTCYIIILICLQYAGDSLEKCVTNKATEKKKQIKKEILSKKPTF